MADNENDEESRAIMERIVDVVNAPSVEAARRERNARIDDRLSKICSTLVILFGAAFLFSFTIAGLLATLCAFAAPVLAVAASTRSQGRIGKLAFVYWLFVACAWAALKFSGVRLVQ